MKSPAGNQRSTKVELLQVIPSLGKAKASEQLVSFDRRKCSKHKETALPSSGFALTKGKIKSNSKQ